MREGDNDCDCNTDKNTSSFAASENPEDIPRKAKPEPYAPRIYNPSAGDSPPDDLDKPHTGKPSPQEIEDNEQDPHNLHHHKSS
jgi:hypothetical protein